MGRLLQLSGWQFLLIYCGIRKEPSFTWRHYCVQALSALIPFSVCFVTCCLYMFQVDEDFSPHLMSTICGGFIVIIVLYYDHMSRSYTTSFKSGRVEANCDTRWERAFSDVYRRCTRRHSMTKALLLGIWVALQSYYLIWASQWDQWTRWSDADIVFSNVTDDRYIMFKNCTEFVCYLKMEHYIMVWLLFFHKFIPAATGVHNNRENFSVDNEQHDTINSFSQIVFLLPCYIWATLHYLNPSFFYLFDFYIDVVCIVMPIIAPMLNYLSLHPSTMGGVLWSIEKAIGLLFGGVAFNFHRVVDLVKFLLTFCIFMLIKAISVNGLMFIILALIYNFIAATTIIDDMLLGVARRRNWDVQINTFNFNQHPGRFKYIHAAILTLMTLIAMICAYMPIDRSWRTEIIIKSTFAVILIVNMASVWLLRIETVVFRYIFNDFIFRCYICAYQIVFYAGPDPLSNQLTQQLIHCVAVFRSFRLLWTNVTIAALAQISAGIIREIVRSRFPVEPVWARDAFCVFYSELIIMMFIRVTARSYSMYQTVRKMEKDNYWRWLRTMPISLFNLLVSAMFDFTFMWTSKGYFIATSWRPVQMQKWNRTVPIQDFIRTLRIKQFEQALPHLRDTLRHMPIGTGLQLVAVSTPPVGYFIFKHGFGYLTNHIEIICMPPDVIKLARKPIFQSLSYNRYKVDVLIDERYWNRLARELGNAIVDYVNFPPKHRDTIDGALTGRESIKPNEKTPPRPTRIGGDDNDTRVIDITDGYPVAAPANIELPGDWLVIPLDESFCNRMASEHGCDNEFYNDLFTDVEVNNDTRVYIHVLIGALLIRLKSLHVKKGVFDEIWSNSDTLQTNALGWIADRAGLAQIVMRASRTALDCYFTAEDDTTTQGQQANIITGAKTDQTIMQAIRDEHPCLTATKDEDQTLNVEKYRRVDLNWTVITHSRVELETLWLSQASWVDEYVSTALRAVKPGTLRGDDQRQIMSFKYKLNY